MGDLVSSSSSLIVGFSVETGLLVGFFVKSESIGVVPSSMGISGASGRTNTVGGGVGGGDILFSIDILIRNCIPLNDSKVSGS